MGKSYLINSSKLQGKITIPSSKSHTLRAILFASLAKGKSIIHHPLPSNDTQSMIQACRILGAKIEEINPYCIEIKGVNGRITHGEDVIHAGNSGIVLRFCSAVGALSPKPIVITGDHSIRYQRPMKPLIESLSQLKVSATSMRGDGFAPLIIQGPIRPGMTTMFGEDSQPVSALLIASAFTDGPTEIHVKNPGEKPWVAMTLHWFDFLGISYENFNFLHYRLTGQSSIEGFEYIVPGDLSSAAFPIAGALVTQSEILINNIDLNDIQGDKALISVFQQMGARIEIDEKNQSLYVKKGSRLNGVKVDINNMIDAITILAVVACFAENETLIYNGSIAKQKECNRIDCIATELRKMGGKVKETSDGLLILPSKLKGAVVHSHHDHRMAMSLSIAAMGGTGETVITETDCVSKTFPSFLTDFIGLGANIKEGR